MELVEQEIKTIESQISPLILQAGDYEINSIEAVDEASGFLKKVKDAEKIIEDKRLEFTKPLNQSLKAINETFKKLKEPLEQARDLVTRKILAWKRIENERVAAEQAEYRKIQEAEAALRLLQGKLEVIEAPIIVAPVINKIGNMQTRKTWTFKVSDFSKIPDEYKSINSVAVNQAIRSGERQIEGLEIYQEESLSIVNR